MQNTYLHAEYSRVFGKTVPNIENLIPCKVSEGSLICLSMISFSDRDNELNKCYLDYLPLSDYGRKEISKYKFNKRPSNFILWAEFLSRDVNSIEISDFKISEYIESVISPLIAINEKTDIETDGLLYVLRSSLYFYQDNILAQYYRSVNIYLNNPILSKYHNFFKDHYEVSLKEYFFVCYLVNCFYTNMNDWKSANQWVLNITKLSQNTGLDVETIKKVMDMISFKSSEMKGYSKSKDCRDHRFNFFTKKPFYNMGNDCYIPTDGKMIQNLVFNNFFYRVKDCSPNKKQFMSDFGKAFEDYSVSLIKYVSDKSTSHNYNFIPEFKYGKPEKLSSDAYLYFNDQVIDKDIVLVFEVKSARILNNVRIFDENRYFIDRSISKLTIEPIEQQIKATYDIVKKEAHKEITKDKVYIFISISMDDFPLNIGEDINLSEDTAKKLKHLKFIYFYSFSVEELEMLCKLISSDLHWSVGFILEKYIKNHLDMSFKTFLLRTMKAIKFKNSNFSNRMLNSQDVLFEYLESCRK